jgi:hypothetical protein
MAPAELLQLLRVLQLHQAGGVGAVTGLDHGVTSVTPRAAHRPVDLAQGVITAERGRLQREKQSFTPEEQKKASQHNAARARDNAKHRSDLAGVDREMQSVQADTELSPKARDKKVADLQKKRGEIAKRFKPRLDLERVTAEADAVMRDPNIKDKKKALDDVRKKHGLSGGQMHGMVTGRLARLTAESKDRLVKTQKAMKKNLGEQLGQAQKVFGKDSPEAAAIKAQIDGIDQVMKPEVNRLSAEAGKLNGAFAPRRRRIGSRIKRFFKKIGRGIKKAFKKVGRFFKKIGKWLLMGLDFLVAGLSFIPGVGQIIGLAYGGIRSIVDFAKGNWKSGLMRLGSMIPGVGAALGLAGKIGGAVGNVVGKVIGGVKKGAGYIKSGVQAIRSGIRKDWLGMAQGIAGVAGAAASQSGTAAGATAATAIGHASKGAGIVDRAARKDFVGALDAAAGFAGGFTGARAEKASDALGHIARGAHVVDRAARKDYVGALGAAANVAGGVGNERGDRAAQALGYAATGAGVVDRAARGDYAGALVNAGGFAGQLGAPVQAQNALAGAGYGVGALQSALGGDVAGAYGGISDALAPTPVGEVLSNAGAHIADALGLDAQRRAELKQLVDNGALQAALLRP